MLTLHLPGCDLGQNDSESDTRTKPNPTNAHCRTAHAEPLPRLHSYDQTCPPSVLTDNSSPVAATYAADAQTNTIWAEGLRTEATPSENQNTLAKHVFSQKVKF